MKNKFGIFGVMFLASCSLAPDYHVPSSPTPTAYKESNAWVEARPSDTIGRGSWWHIFQDAQLDQLEDQVTTANQDLKVALAQYEEAHAIAVQAGGAYFPEVDGEGGAQRLHNSRNLANRSPVSQYNDFSFGADLSYEIDVWGRVRNTVAASEDQASASAADLAGVALSLHAELASDYFSLRSSDMSQDILDKTVAVDQQALELVKRRFNGGVSDEGEVDQAILQLENAKTQASDMRLRRSQYEHAIAVLVGKAPADFNLPPSAIRVRLAPLNPGLPSTLLERRPDVAAAERRVAAANAEIGVARAAYFPTFSLSGSLGFESATGTALLDAPSHFWSLGQAVSLPLFTGGAINALNDQARAAYDEAAASYRQTVLKAYQDVEDNLTASHHLSFEQKTQDAAVIAAKRALIQSNNQYKGGLTTYLDVVVVQNSALQAELDDVTIITRRLQTNVQLVKALGGGWTAADIKTFEEQDKAQDHKE